MQWYSQLEELKDAGHAPRPACNCLCLVLLTLLLLQEAGVGSGGLLAPTCPAMINPEP